MSSSDNAEHGPLFPTLDEHRAMHAHEPLTGGRMSAFVLNPSWRPGHLYCFWCRWHVRLEET